MSDTTIKKTEQKLNTENKHNYTQDQKFCNDINSVLFTLKGMSTSYAKQVLKRVEQNLDDISIIPD